MLNVDLTQLEPGIYDVKYNLVISLEVLHSLGIRDINFDYDLESYETSPGYMIDKYLRGFVSEHISCKSKYMFYMDDLASKISRYAFYKDNNFEVFVFSLNIKFIGTYAFAYSSIKIFVYKDTIVNWAHIWKEFDWDIGLEEYKILCLDGVISVSHENGNKITKIEREE